MKETVSMQLFQIHASFKINFKVVVVDNSEVKKNFPVINKFSYVLNEYVNITPYPFIEIDIQTRMDKQNGGNLIKKMGLTRRDIFILISKLSRLEKELTSDNGLFFFTSEGDLTVNADMANQKMLVYENNSNHLEMRPIVVPSKDSNKVYEGVLVLFGKNWDNYTYLTTSEVSYLLYELKHMDISSLTIQLINTYLLMKESEAKPIEIKNKNQEPVTETPEIEISSGQRTVYSKDEPVIPDI